MTAVEAEADVEPPPPEVPGEAATVVHVVDGDTFDVAFPAATTERVRFPQIDTPTMVGCNSSDTADWLRRGVKALLGRVATVACYACFDPATNG